MMAAIGIVRRFMSLVSGVPEWHRVKYEDASLSIPETSLKVCLRRRVGSLYSRRSFFRQLQDWYRLCLFCGVPIPLMSRYSLDDVCQRSLPHFEQLGRRNDYMVQTSASFRSNPSATDCAISFSEVISALSYALDLT